MDGDTLGGRHTAGLGKMKRGSLDEVGWGYSPAGNGKHYMLV